LAAGSTRAFAAARGEKTREQTGENVGGNRFEELGHGVVHLGGWFSVGEVNQM
jgi:hypothetical protein